MTSEPFDASVAALHVFPVKSCAGIAPESAQLVVTGMRADGVGDREWMVVGHDRRFLTQRESPRLALVRVSLERGVLVLAAPDRPPIAVPAPSAASMDVTVWRDTVRAADAGDDVAHWLSALLGRDARLVHFDPASRRPCDSAYVGDSGAHTLFADGYPILVVAAASLAELNRRLALQTFARVPMNRFRPNVVLDGLAPHDEDHIDTIVVGDATLRLVKPCTRCTITTTDQATAMVGLEPLRTLAGYRQDDRAGGVTFGMNAIVERPGRLAVGDAVRVTWRF